MTTSVKIPLSTWNGTAWTEQSWSADFNDATYVAASDISGLYRVIGLFLVSTAVQQRVTEPYTVTLMIRARGSNAQSININWQFPDGEGYLPVGTPLALSGTVWNNYGLPANIGLSGMDTLQVFYMTSTAPFDVAECYCLITWNPEPGSGVTPLHYNTRNRADQP